MKQLLSLLATFTFTLGSSLKTDVRLSEGMDTMARKLYHELVDLPENLLISPLSIFSAMGLLQRGAPKGSRTQLQLHIATMGRFVLKIMVKTLLTSSLQWARGRVRCTIRGATRL